jgi:RsiW-degrading membrane proteinase PrsW (M82 family)
MVLGRDPRCAIVVDAQQYGMVSREHAVIRPLRPQAGASESWQHPRPQAASQPNQPTDVTALGDVGDRSQPSSDPSLSGRWQVCDLNSANGTYVNGHRLRGCQVLEWGDRLQLGQAGPLFCFEYQRSPAQSRAEFGSSVKASSGPGSSPGPEVASYFARFPTGPNPAGPSPAGPHPAGFRPVTLSQLFPLLSTGNELVRKAYLIPGMITVGLVVSLFLTVGQPRWFNGLLATYLSFGGYYFVYRLCGKPKPWWLPVLTAGLTLALLSTPLLTLALWIFRELLPGAIPTAGEQLPIPLLFSRMLLGAGLMEELLKILPLLILVAVGRRLDPPWRDRLGIWEPLDGILLGAASAVGFTLLETLGQYVPDMAQMTAASGVDAGQLAGLQLLIPRLLGSVAGHIAYSGYFGYFVGLSVMLPQRRWLILGVGYGTAALLHALWNVMGSYSALLLAAVGVLSYACLVAAILKARSLSPHRAQNFATQFSKAGRSKR